MRQACGQVGQPMMGVALKRLKKAYETFLANGDVARLLAVIREDLSGPDAPAETTANPATPPLTAQDLKLVCREYVCS